MFTPVNPDQPCTVCNGQKIVPGGAWTTENEADECTHCGGTGIEPVKQKPSQSSPFEDEGTGIGDGPNL